MKRRTKNTPDATVVVQEIDYIQTKNGSIEGSEIISSKITLEKLSNTIVDKQDEVIDEESVNQYINNCRLVMAYDDLSLLE